LGRGSQSKRTNDHENDHDHENERTTTNNGNERKRRRYSRPRSLIHLSSGFGPASFHERPALTYQSNPTNGTRDTFTWTGDVNGLVRGSD